MRERQSLSTAPLSARWRVGNYNAYYYAAVPRGGGARVRIIRVVYSTENTAVAAAAASASR